MCRTRPEAHALDRRPCRAAAKAVSPAARVASLRARAAARARPSHRPGRTPVGLASHDEAPGAQMRHDPLQFRQSRGGVYGKLVDQDVYDAPRLECLLESSPDARGGRVELVVLLRLEIE